MGDTEEKTITQVPPSLFTQRLILCYARSPQSGDLSNVYWEIEMIESVWVTLSPVKTYQTDTRIRRVKAMSKKNRAR